MRDPVDCLYDFVEQVFYFEPGFFLFFQSKKIFTVSTGFSTSDFMDFRLSNCFDQCMNDTS